METGLILEVQYKIINVIHCYKKQYVYKNGQQKVNNSGERYNRH